MKNQVYMGPPTGARFVACPTTVKSGDAVLVGAEPAVALNDYQSNSGGATFCFGGSFNLTVVGSSTHSPFTPEALNSGDKVFASGTLDSPTNVTTGLLITGTTTDTPFGYIDPSGPGVSSGATNTATPVRLLPSN